MRILCKGGLGMNYASKSRILYSILLSFFCSNLPAQIKKRAVDPALSNYYELIGFNYDQYKNEMQNKIKAANVQAAQKFQTEREAAKRKLDKAEETQRLAVKDLPAAVIEKNRKEYEAAQAAYQDIIQQQENLALTTAYQDKDMIEKITQACQQARKNYQKEIEKAQKAVEEEIDEVELVAKHEEVARLQKRLATTATACPLLLNPAKRQTYDAQLAGAPLAAGFFDRVQRSVSNAMLLAPDKKVLINDIVGDLLSQIEIPGPALKIFNQDLDVRSISLLPKPMGPDVQYGIGFTGLIALNRLEVRLSVYIIQDIYGARKFSFTVDLPTTYKISDLFPTFNGLDAFRFPQMKFIISNFTGIDQDGFPFKKGFNFGAILDLSGPLQLLGDLRDKASALKSLVFESKPIILNGVIPPNITQAEFRAEVPLYIGVDLQKISAMPRTISNVIHKITSDDFVISISPVKPKKAVGAEKGQKVTETVKPYIELLKVEREPTVEIVTLPNGEEDFVFKKPKIKTVASIPFGYKVTAETGIRITLGTQPQPIRINVHGIIIPISKSHPQGMLTLGGSVKGMLEFGPFALGDLILEFDWDPVLLGVAASFGIPFTGMGIGGKLYLGTPGDARAALEAAGGFRVSSGEIPDIVLQLAGDNIQFGTIIRYAMQKAAQAKILKAPIPVDRIPTMTLHNIWGYCAVKDTTIAGKLYRGGMGLQVEAQFFEYKAGLRIFVDNQFKVSGWGYMPPVDFKVKGAEVFRLYGLTPDKGPRMSFSFDPKDPLKGIFGVQGTVHLPTFGVRQKTDFMWRGHVLDADFETEFPGFSVLFGIRMNLKEGMEMLSPYDEMKRSVEQLLASVDMQSAEGQQAKKLFDEVAQLESKGMQVQAMTRLDQIRALLSKADTQLVEAEKVPAGDIKALEDQMRALKADVDTLAQRAVQKKDDTRYKAAEGLIRQAVIGYRDYHGVAAQKEPMAAKVKRLTTIIDNLNKARTWLYKVLEEVVPVAREVETDSGAKWSKLYIKFGFKGDFARFLNEHAVTTLRKIKENAIKKLDQLTEKIAGMQAQAVGWVETEVKRVQEIITAKEKEISGLQTQCRSLPLYQQPKCRASIAAQQAVLASRKAYLVALSKPGKAVVRGVVGAAAAAGTQLAQSKALRAATEAILESAATGLEMIATGINFFNITEARGEYSWEDMRSLRLPRLVQLIATIDIPGMPMRIVLNDLQFDFKHPAQSAAEITHSIMSAFIENQQNKYLKFVERFMTEEE